MLIVTEPHQPLPYLLLRAAYQDDIAAALVRMEVDMPRASWRLPRLSLTSCPIYLSPATARMESVRLHPG
jgi:hypothetical protein